MQVTQIKYWSKLVQNEVVDHVTISYRDNGSDVIKHEFGNNSTAAPEFYNDFENLSPFVCKICSMDKKYESAISVRDVKIAPSEDKEGEDNTVYTLTAGFKAGLATATLKVSVNHKNIPENFDEAIQNLVNEAEEYLGGKRAQTEMEFNEDEGPEPEEEPEEEDDPEEPEEETE